MDLEERKAYRKEMLSQSIRETFLSMQVINSMYRFEVIAVDVRHHRFSVMIDVAKSFLTDKVAQTRNFAGIETLMRTNTYKRFGILIVAVYWRVSECYATQATALPQGVPHGSVRTKSTQTPDQALAHQVYQAVSADETKAFMDALRKGQTQPVVHVGDLAYQTDLTPLDCGIMIGGTQYGKL